MTELSPANGRILVQREQPMTLRDGLRQWWVVSRFLRPMRSSNSAVHWTRIRTKSEYDTYLSVNAYELDKQRAFERTLAQSGRPFTIQAECAPCRCTSMFAVDYQFAYVVDGVLNPNWRERLLCQQCGLNNRMRATIHAFGDLLNPPSNASVLLAEAVTPLAKWMRSHYSGTVGCEFLGEAVPFGAADERGVRNEDFTCLTFRDEQFDLVIALDILEHIPEYGAALRECRRVLKPGGRFVFSVPFRFDLQEHLVRARVRTDGSIEHVLEPEYHGDPLDQAGCLCYYHFGWALLDDVIMAGLRNPCMYLYWSSQFAYLGSGQFLITAQR